MSEFKQTAVEVPLEVQRALLHYAVASTYRDERVRGDVYAYLNGICASAKRVPGLTQRLREARDEAARLEEGLQTARREGYDKAKKSYEDRLDLARARTRSLADGAVVGADGVVICLGETLYGEDNVAWRIVSASASSRYELVGVRPEPVASLADASASTGEAVRDLRASWLSHTRR